MKKKTICFILLSIFLFNVISLVAGVTTITIDHNNYFKQYTLSGENLQLSLEGLPDPATSNIQYDIGDRQLISLIPIDSTVIDSETALLKSEAVIESTFNIYTTYGIQDLFPNARQDEDFIEWAWVRTCTDWNHPNEFWMFQWRPVVDYFFVAKVNNWIFGPLASNGFSGNIEVKQEIVNFDPSTISFNDLSISVTTKAFSSVLTKSVVSESSISDIGKYDDYYTGDQVVDISLTATELQRNYESETNNEISNIDISSNDDADDVVAGRLQSLNCGIRLHNVGQQTPNPVIYQETPWTATQKKLAPTIGSDITQKDNKIYILLHPDITISKRNLYVTTTSPTSIDVDTEGGLIFSQPTIVNQPSSRTYVYSNTVSSHVNNTLIKFKLQSTFLLYSYVSILNAQGEFIDLQDPNFKIGDRYWDITIGGDVGGNVTYEEPSDFNFWTMFGGLFSWLIGIGVAILAIYLAITIGPQLIGSRVQSTKRKLKRKQTESEIEYEKESRKLKSKLEKEKRKTK